MDRDVACTAAAANAVLRSESIPFSDIPGQSKLFLQYQNDPSSLKRFYPSAVSSHTDLAFLIDHVLSVYSIDRGELASALGELNRSFGGGDKALENIELVTDPGTVTVVTGQQAGLFTGPLYTIYKALSAVRAAECLRGRGFKAVPVFWIATEDHDFAEVDVANVIDREGRLLSTTSNASHSEGKSVGSAQLNESIDSSIENVFSALKHTEFTDQLRHLVADAYSAETNFGTAFGKMLAALTRDYGLVIVDPLHPALKQLASPIYIEAIRRSREIANALADRDQELQSAGFEPQVAVDKDYFPLFWHSETGERLALRFDKEGSIRAKNGNKFSIDQLTNLAEKHPERFSPNVMLRPVVQDFLFPTICYFGGGAEISYFAQNSEVYRCLDRPVTPILHRQSFTVVEPKHRRTLQTYDLRLTDLFAGLESILPQIVDEHLDRSTAQTFAEVEEAINTQLNRLDRELSDIDAGLAANLATRRRKIIYHIAALRDKFRRSELRKDETIDRRISSLFNSLLAKGALQERTINPIYFLNTYGPKFVHLIYESIDLDDRGHRVVYF